MEWSQTLFTQDPAAEGSVEGDEEAVAAAAATTETRLSEGGIVQLSTTSRADLDLDDDEDGGSDEGGVALALCVISLDRCTLALDPTKLAWPPPVLTALSYRHPRPDGSEDAPAVVVAFRR
jgi:hypothetical protein